VPTYQYQCTECGSALEVIQSFSDDALTECPECSGRLRKVFNAVGVVFKGSGFYRTDSRSTSTSSDAAKNGSATKESKPKESSTEAPATAG
jgi:putative FmdB family regulatory protein